MKRLQIQILCIVTLCMMTLLFHSCTCKSCDDPNLVKVPAMGFGQLSYHWEMAQAVLHSNNTATSSIQIIPNGTTSVNSVAADSVTTTIYLVAEDTVAGIKCIQLVGGFGYTCTNVLGDGAIAIDGKIADRKECTELTKCCLRKNSIQYDDLGAHMQCAGGRNFSSGGVGLTGFIQNCLGVTDTAFLQVNFN